MPIILVLLLLMMCYSCGMEEQALYCRQHPLDSQCHIETKDDSHEQR